MRIRKPRSSVALFAIALILGATAGVATAWPTSASDDDVHHHDEAVTAADRPVAPQRDEKVTIGDGLGNSRSDLTYGEFLDEIERLGAAQSAPEGFMHVYGLLPSGEIGVTGVCIELPAPDGDPLPEQGADDSDRTVPEGDVDVPGWECRPAPGLEVPGHNVSPSAPQDFWERVPPEALP